MFSSSQFYGAGNYLPKKGGLLPNASWTHGVIYFPSPYSIISREDSVFDFHLVTNQAQADLASSKFSNVIPVGLPYAHAYKNFYDSSYEKDISRLFLSRHSIKGERDDPLKDMISKAKEFECDALCLQGDQFIFLFGTEKDWISSEGIRVFKGASTRDAKSYERIISIFSRTQTLVSDCAGSHPYYAVVCESKFELHYEKFGQDIIQAKVIAATKGLIEPWKSAMKEHVLNYEFIESEIKEFSGLRFDEMKKVAFEKIGIQYVDHFKDIKEEIEKTSFAKLLLINALLFDKKSRARFL